MKKNYYSFNHEAMNKNFPGGLTYVNDFCINGEYMPVAVYKVEKPNREKGHKDFLLIQTNENGGLIRGLNSSEMEKWKYQDAIQCPSCKDVIYSVMRHDFRSCECGKVSVDGGRDYIKTRFKKERPIHGVINLLTDEFKVDE